MTDDRIMCADCRCFDAERSVCRAAQPVMGQIGKLLHRLCPDFWPRPHVTDQRRGTERWPESVDEPVGPRRIPHPARPDNERRAKRS